MLMYRTRTERRAHRSAGALPHSRLLIEQAGCPLSASPASPHYPAGILAAAEPGPSPAPLSSIDQTEHSSNQPSDETAIGLISTG